MAPYYFDLHWLAANNGLDHIAYNRGLAIDQNASIGQSALSNDLASF